VQHLTQEIIVLGRVGAVLHRGSTYVGNIVARYSTSDQVASGALSITTKVSRIAKMYARLSR
jgi:hypothetical protein